jgi:hypothetical protein
MIDTNTSLFLRSCGRLFLSTTYFATTTKGKLEYTNLLYSGMRPKLIQRESGVNIEDFGFLS